MLTQCCGIPVVASDTDDRHAQQAPGLKSVERAECHPPGQIARHPADHYRDSRVGVSGLHLVSPAICARRLTIETFPVLAGSRILRSASPGAITGAAVIAGSVGVELPGGACHLMA